MPTKCGVGSRPNSASCSTRCRLTPRNAATSAGAHQAALGGSRRPRLTQARADCRQHLAVSAPKVTRAQDPFMRAPLPGPGPRRPPRQRFMSRTSSSAKRAHRSLVWLRPASVLGEPDGGHRTAPFLHRARLVHGSSCPTAAASAAPTTSLSQSSFPDPREQDRICPCSHGHSRFDSPHLARLDYHLHSIAAIFAPTFPERTHELITYDPSAQSSRHPTRPSAFRGTNSKQNITGARERLRKRTSFRNSWMKVFPSQRFEHAPEDQPRRLSRAVPCTAQSNQRSYPYRPALTKNSGLFYDLLPPIHPTTLSKSHRRRDHATPLGGPVCL